MRLLPEGTISDMQLATLMFCAFLWGLAKTGLPGVGILGVPLMASVIPPRVSTGVVLPLLIVGDLFAVSYYRRHAVWKRLIPLLPWAVVGVYLGYLAMDQVNDRQLGRIIGLIVLVILAFNAWRNRRAEEELKVPTQWWFAGAVGLIAGVTTMMANAAGPIMMVYLLAMKLPKREFIGTGAWYFLFVNLLKVPFSYNLGLINTYSLRLDLYGAPFVALGAIAGILILKKIPQKRFTQVVQVFAALAAAKLLAM